MILEENEQRHQEVLHKVASLEAEVTKWRAIARTIWRVKCLKVANAIIAFPEAVRSNHQLSSKVGVMLAKLLRTRLDGDELFKRCKDLQVEKKDLVGKVENIATEKGKLAKVVANLEARLKDSESRLKESELRATKEREANKELEEELLVYKKEVVE